MQNGEMRNAVQLDNEMYSAVRHKTYSGYIILGHTAQLNIIRHTVQLNNEKYSVS